MAQKDPIAEAIKKETRMQARVAKQVARMKREITLFYPSIQEKTLVWAEYTAPFMAPARFGAGN